MTFWNSHEVKRDWTFVEACANRSQQAVSEESTAELLGKGETLTSYRLKSSDCFGSRGGIAMMDRPSGQELERKPVRNEPFVPEPLLDTDQAAAIMRIHPKTLQRYARQGIVRGFQLGSMWRFRASDIDRWITEQLAS